MKLLAVRSLSIRVENRPLLSDQCFDLFDGDVLQIVGPNGSGKTTLLRTLLGFLPSCSGEIDFFIGKTIGRTVAYLPQDSQNTLLPWLTGGKNILIGLVNSLECNRSELFRALATEYCQSLSPPDAKSGAKSGFILDWLAGGISKMPSVMSGGERQKVAILRALIAKPRVLFLDEPFRELDVRAVEALRKYIAGFVSDGTGAVVYVSHQEVELSPNKVIRMGVEP
jgi:ABC-type multidrug transport system ATPase subunit